MAKWLRLLPAATAYASMPGLGEPGGCVAEENESQDGGAQASGAGIDSAAVALALGGASREKADAFLDDQRILMADQRGFISDQRHHLHEQTKSLKIGIFNERLSASLKVLTAFAGLAVAGFICVAVWNAAHADGLVIDTFSVPPELAQIGLTGEVVASRMLDRLIDLQNGTVSVRAAQSFDNNWGNDIKVEIPETGVSFGEAYRYLKGWLGHETHLSGEVVRSETKVTLTTRVSGESGASFSGTEADLGGLVEMAAENVYGRTQPYRYAVYLGSHGRPDEAFEVYRNLAKAGSRKDRPWGYMGWSHETYDSETTDVAKRMIETAFGLEPDNAVVVGELAIDEVDRSHPENALRFCMQTLSILGHPDQQLISPSGVVIVREENEARAAGLTGDFQKAAQTLEDVVANRATGQPTSPFLALFQTHEHDLAAARATLEEPAQGNVFSPLFNAIWGIAAQMSIDNEAQDWSGVIARRRDLLPLSQKYPGTHFRSLALTVPLTAYAEARLGKIADAEKHITATPADCYDCLKTRARIAELEGQHARADWWFGRAVKNNPTIPLAYTDWGQAFLARGDPAGAIAKFKLASQKGPHFADPLEGWGEALMLQNRSDLARAKFADAEKYAPNWGRLHLKWGEALVYAGKKDEAQKQFAQAATLDLTPREKSELLRMNHA